MQNTEVYLRKTIDMQIIFKKFFCGEGGCEKPRALGRLGLCGDCCFGVFGGSLVEGVGDGGDYAHALDVW